MSPREASRRDKFPFGIAGVAVGEIEREIPPGEAPPLPPNDQLAFIGKRVPRINGRAKVTGAARWVLGFSLLAGALVLAAALTMSAAERRHETALLRTLGARSGQLRLAALCEFALLGAVSGLTALFGSAAAGAWLAHAVFRIRDFAPPWAPLLIAAAASAIIVAALGLAGTRRILRASPLLILRRG